jgi:UDP-N-acetylmuramyl pentapeptide phosphotransferase/UDP-N-acetylglucosamine-1-phosphate transferase
LRVIWAGEDPGETGTLLLGVVVAFAGLAVVASALAIAMNCPIAPVLGSTRRMS